LQAPQCACSMQNSSVENTVAKEGQNLVA